MTQIIVGIYAFVFVVAVVVVAFFALRLVRFFLER
jgi:hypothetical protein